MLVSNQVKPNYAIAKVANPRNARTTVLAHKSLIPNTGVPECSVVSREKYHNEWKNILVDMDILRFSGVSNVYKSSILVRIFNDQRRFAVINCDLQNDNTERAKELVETLEYFNIVELDKEQFNIVVCCKINGNVLKESVDARLFKDRDNWRLWITMAEKSDLSCVARSNTNPVGDCPNIFYHGYQGRFVKIAQQGIMDIGDNPGLMADFTLTS
jgi:hypothetical protein